MANYYLTFNGSTQYGTATGYKGVTGTSACTVMGWFRTTDNGSGNQCLIHWGTNSTFARRFIGLESGVLWDRMVGDIVNGGSNLADGNWHHFAITNPMGATAHQFLIYIDGVSVSVNVTSTGGSIGIGSGVDVHVATLNALYFDGSLDDFRLYNAELTAQQILDFYNEGIEPPTTNLQAHWLFNEGSGTTVNDETANNRDLTLVNAPTWTRHPIIIVKDSEGMTIDDDEIDPIDFGTTAQNETALTQDFTITNNGDDDLIISSISTPAGYSVSGISLPATILTGEEETFVISLATGTVGTFSGEVVIEENDPDIFDFNFAVTGEIIEPQNIVIKTSGGDTIADGETTPQSFGNTNQGEAAPTLTFTIENTGETTLTISSINLPTGYSISGATPSSVAGLSTETFTVSLSTATAGTFAGDVEVNSDDPDIAVYNFAITGTVIPSNVEPIEAELVTYLVAEISDVSSRIHPGWIPRGETRPTIAVHRRSGGYAHELTGSAGFASPEFQISVFSDDYSEARDLTEQVRVALQGYTGLMGTQTIYSITKTNEFELYEPPKDGSHNGIYHVASFFNVLHKITALTLDAPSGVVSNTDVIAALITYLLDESSLTDLISTALHPLNVPRGTALPYVTVQKKSSEDAHDLEGSAGFASARVEFICYADNYPDAVEIRDEIRLLLDGLSGVHSGCEIHAVTAQQSSDAPKLPNDGSKKWDAEISLSFDVLYRQFIPTF